MNSKNSDYTERKKPAEFEKNNIDNEKKKKIMREQTIRLRKRLSMYIRKSTRSYKGKTYTNYVLVESVHTPKGPRQTTICSLGDLSPRPREEWLKLTRKIEDALTGQGRLL